MILSRRQALIGGSILLLGLLYLQRRALPDQIRGGDNDLVSFDGVGVFEVETDNGTSSCPVKTRGELRPGRSKGRPIQFIHLPKAGGTSVQESLQRWASSQGIPVTLHDGDGPTWNGASGKGLFLGHRGFGYSQRVKDRNPVTIIALREPVSRIVSLFDYLRRTDETAPQVVQIRKAWSKRSLDEVVESYRAALDKDPLSVLPGGKAGFSDRTLHRVLRGQIQFLCGFECVWFMTGDARESLGPFEDVSQGKDLARAQRHLEQVDCVAVLNRLDDLLVQLKAHFDFVPPNFNAFPHENSVSAEDKSKPSEATLELLRSWTQDEQALFERAKVIAARKTAQAAQCLASTTT